MRTSDISSSEPDDPDKYIWSGSSYSSSWYSDSETDCNRLSSMQLSSESWTGVGGVNGIPADADDVSGGDGTAVAAAAVVAFPSFNVAMDICSMTTLIRLLLEGRRSPFFFNLPIFVRAIQLRRRRLHVDPVCAHYDDDDAQLATITRDLYNDDGGGRYCCCDPCTTAYINDPSLTLMFIIQSNYRTRLVSQRQARDM